jgi:hypothetical protein
MKVIWNYIDRIFTLRHADRAIEYPRGLQLPDCTSCFVFHELLVNFAC